MTGAVYDRTGNLGLGLIEFNFPNWGDDSNNNTKIIDASFAAIGLIVRGAWQYNTLYTVTDIVADTDTSQLWRCLISHTSASSGTFAEYRTANPTHWGEVADASSSLVFDDITANNITADALNVVTITANGMAVNFSDIGTAQVSGTLEVDGVATFNTNVNITGTLTAGSIVGPVTSTGVAALTMTNGSTINWNSGDLILTHSSNVLTLTGGTLKVSVPGTTSGAVVTTDASQTLTSKTIVSPNITGIGSITGASFEVTSAIFPDAANGAVIGTGALGFSELHLGTGAFINWNNGDVTLTHSANTLTMAGGVLVVSSIGSSFSTTVESATTSGTSVDVTSIPSWATEITVSLAAVSTNGTSVIALQLGDAGGIEATSYVSRVENSGTDISVTTAFALSSGNASSAVTGIVTLIKTVASTNAWVISGHMMDAGTATAVNNIAGWKATSAALDRIRLTTVAGTATFDAGTVTVRYS